MELNILNEVAALQRLSIAQLRQRYAEVFGEATAAGNRTWLTKRIAWRCGRPSSVIPMTSGSIRTWQVY